MFDQNSMKNALTPKRVTQILSDLQTKHTSDIACHEDAKYPITFILTSYLKEEYRFEIWPNLVPHPGPNTFLKRIGPMIIYTKLDQNQMKTVGGIVFVVKCYQRTPPQTDEVGSVKLT